MPIPTSFHPRTSKLCESHRWKDWAGFHAVCFYRDCHLSEYFAFRHAAGLLDVSPLFKYRVSGPQAADFLAFVLARDARRIKPGRVAYSTWCDERGRIVDDGTVLRIEEDRFRVTSATPCLAWFEEHAAAFDVTLDDEGDQVAALALQGPCSRAIATRLCGEVAETLRFFSLAPVRIAGTPALISRTGYTGDLGYEIWCPQEQAVPIWDAVMEAGQDFRLLPAGLDALDMTRIEAGFILNGVDYFGAHACDADSQTSTPFELDLGWTVHLDREPFLGRDALRAESARGPAHLLVGLELDQNAIEALYEAEGIPPALPSGGWRTGVPVYSGRTQIGRATSGTWSPTIQRNLALATVPAQYAQPGTRLEMEWTVEYVRQRVGAVVVPRPFFDPERKRA
ncbi:MAG: aminomethyltransferase family protein [Phycisphaerales bacterium]|nr:aminomethyltransferase family protein [Phycisphaerales bacterium]